ncbi:MAG: hypothetical protein KGL77_05595 [Actinomycetales bacterium]|nr:hypothetical protein [Actinomycetales bacterium]
MTSSNSPQNDEQSSESAKGGLPGIIVISLGALTVIAPLFYASATTSSSSNWLSEGDSSSGGSAIWLMILTVPLGIAIIFAGIAVWRAGIARAKNLGRMPARSDLALDEFKVKRKAAANRSLVVGGIGSLLFAGALVVQQINRAAAYGTDAYAITLNLGGILFLIGPGLIIWAAYSYLTRQ